MATRKCASVVAVLALASSFNVFAADTCRVSANLLHNGKSFGQPVALVKAGTPARVERSGPDGYTLSFTVTDLAPDRLKIAATLDSSHGTLSPVVVVRPNQPSTSPRASLGWSSPSRAAVADAAFQQAHTQPRAAWRKLYAR